jgi:hypothetical protein
MELARMYLTLQMVQSLPELRVDELNRLQHPKA